MEVNWGQNKLPLLGMKVFEDGGEIGELHS